MNTYDVIIIGGGAAGMFAAAVCAEYAPDLRVLILEQSGRLLSKVRVSGGGRCNLTHACNDIRSFVQNYPRGAQELIGPFHQFGPDETVAWFEAHHVPLVTLDDGCRFPESDSAETIIDALFDTIAGGHVEIQTHADVLRVDPPAGDADAPQTGTFRVTLADGRDLHSHRVLIATGGGECLEGLEHAVEPCVPSLFTFNTNDRELTELAGIVIDEVAVRAVGVESQGALLITHTGVSGPAILRLSSHGARPLAACHYDFEMTINWCPSLREEELFEVLSAFRVASPRKQVGTWSPVGLSLRIWRLLVRRAGLTETREWGNCSIKALRHIAAQVHRFDLQVSGKNRHREEFVTCGGIRLKEVNFKTMESRLHPGLYLAGEVLDIDALTGGFNLQAAWTTGYIAALNLMGE
jgi:predicted Rossmann fold flavoprotein